MDPVTLHTYKTRDADFAARYGAADLAPLHRLLLAHLPPAGRVLEVGCGTGREAAFLAGRGFTVIATNASEAMLDQARQVTNSDQGAGEPLAAQYSTFRVERSLPPNSLSSYHQPVGERSNAFVTIAAQSQSDLVKGMGDKGKDLMDTSILKGLAE